MVNGEDKRITKRITVYGIVQGVGFRPLVYHIARKHNILGTVRNIGGLVEIITQSTERDFEDFLQELKTSECGGCEIVKIEIEDYLAEKFSDFKIIESSADEQVSIIPPDLPVCLECQKELYTDSDRRLLNPFISCMSCGPRYTIIEELPYDRCNTTMKDFTMCHSCNKDYTSPDNRRFHAQTISCYDCGPYLIFRGLTVEQELFEKEALEAAIAIILSGGIVAVKGIGGYHFVCSPFDESTVLDLRKLKGREEKPFAVMFENLSSVEEYCVVSEEERELLESKARPIVLLYTKEKNHISTVANQGSIYCGAFLPYTALQMLLTKRCGPLIMTSANISNQPIIREDEVMLSLKSPYLKGVLYNTRHIVRSVDDSVAKIIHNKPQLIRRSRGYVPYPVFLQTGKQDIQILAAGGDLKAAFCLYKNGSAVVSQYFGDLEECSVMKEYETSIADLLRLLKITPELAVCDYHPNYYSSGYIKTLGIPVLQVQHHHAHVASVMAEHQLDEPVIGVAFDGTGYGTDGNIWGGEFLVCEGATFLRAAHLEYTPILGGDKSMRDAKKTATCYLLNSGLSDYIQDDRRDIIEAAVINKVNTVLTSSMGRLFDAVASILNVGQENRYEGECAANLEREAVLFPAKPEKLTFAYSKKSGIIEIDPKPVLEGLCRLRETVEIGALALGFHFAVADMINEVCENLRSEQNINAVALCGGVFQNTILTERTMKVLKEKGFRVYVNEAVPPNDGSISLGQTYLGLKN